MVSAVWSQEPVSFDLVFVGRVPRGTTEPELRAALALAGTYVGDIEFALDRVSGLQRGFAFVRLLARMDTRTDGLELGRLRAATLHGQPLDVQGIRPQLRRRSDSASGLLD